MKPANFAAVYCCIYPELAEVARSHGYALAIHGSMARDFDLIAIPWVDEPSTPDAVIAEITGRFAIELLVSQPTIKPHGRIVYTLSLGFGECQADFSFMTVKP